MKKKESFKNQERTNKSRRDWQQKVAANTAVARDLFGLDSAKNRLHDASVDSTRHEVLGNAVDLETETRAEAYGLMLQARHAVANNPIAKSIINALVLYVIGSHAYEIIPKPLLENGELDEDLQAVLKERWQAFSREPLVNRRGTNLHAVYTMLAECWFRDGDVFLEIRENPKEQTFKVRIYSAEKLGYESATIGETFTSSQILPIEVDEENTPTRYNFIMHVKEYDTKKRVVSVKAENVLSLATIIDPDQLRGVTILAPVLELMNNLSTYIHNEVVAGKLRNMVLGAFSVDNDSPMAENSGDDPDEGNTDVALRSIGKEIGYIHLPRGYKFAPFDSKNTINTEATNYINQMLRIISSGVGVDFEAVSNLYENSYSAARQSMLQTQAKIYKFINQFISSIVDPLYRRFVDFVLLTEYKPLQVAKLKQSNIYNYALTLPKLPNIDPSKDAEANIKRLQMGLITPQGLAAEQGADYGQTLQDIAHYKRLCQELGIDEVYYTHFGLTNYKDKEEKEQAKEEQQAQDQATEEPQHNKGQE